ncbi:MAG TPA: peptidylprolyl isomerase [Patescibacteria group bacterium]|nr:peptidylprolyl isomerase [Patescibacteria group bacterium]
MKKLSRILALVFLLALAPIAAHADTGVERIAVVINDDVITASEVAARTRLILVSSGLPNTPEVRQKLEPQILNSLIEERLMMQEAKRDKIEVSKDEIAHGFETVAKQNNLTPDQFKQILAHNNIPVHTLEDQIEAQVAWGDVIQKKIRPDVSISDAEVETALARMKGNIGKDQYRVADIFLPVGTPQEDGKVHALADKLVMEMTQNHVPFPRVASQFSQAAGASRGGDLGWVQEGQLDPKLDNIITHMKEGELARPVRTDDGYHILFLRQKTTVTEQSLPSHAGMLEHLGLGELERRQRRFLMDLKASAFIEHRA